jgi:hypothetical protein
LLYDSCKVKPVTGVIAELMQGQTGLCRVDARVVFIYTRVFGKRICNGVVVDERTLYSTTNNSISSWDMVVQYV